MDNQEKAKYIDLFLDTLYNASFPTSLASGIELKQLPSKENKQKFKTLEYILEELDLVELVHGRDNSTVGGQCEYFISGKGRQMVERNESSLSLLLANDLKKELANNPLFDEEEWNKHIDLKIEKRANNADFYLDIIVSENLLNLDKETIRQHFKKWFKESKDFNLQSKEGDFAIEDGDIQVIPDFRKNDISEFINWFNVEKENFKKLLHEQGVETETNIKSQIISNQGKMIVNQNSMIKNQVLDNDNNQSESKWSKAQVIISAIVGIATIIGIVWNFFT